MNVVFATSNAWITQGVYTAEGEPWDAEDPLVKSRADMFSDDPKYARRSSPYVPVETASADPSEGRTARRPRTTAATK